MFMRNINNTLPLQQERHVPQINNSFNNVHKTSPAIIKQQSCGGFGTNSIINSSFINTLNAHFQKHKVKVFFFRVQSSSNSYDSATSNAIIENWCYKKDNHK
jgi:hypothetical protein